MILYTSTPLQDLAHIYAEILSRGRRNINRVFWNKTIFGNNRNLRPSAYFPRDLTCSSSPSLFRIEGVQGNGWSNWHGWSLFIVFVDESAPCQLGQMSELSGPRPRLVSLTWNDPLIIFVNDKSLQSSPVIKYFWFSVFGCYCTKSSEKRTWTK